MYVNGDYRGDNPLGKLMHDFSTPDADKMYYDELARRVRFHKQDEKGVQTMCKIVEEYGDERAAEAFKQGEQKKAVEAAKNLYANGVSVSLIADSLNMTEEQIKEIVQGITVTA